MPYDFSMKLTSALKRAALVATLALSLGIALPTASNAEPGRTWEIEIDALTYSDQNPTNLEEIEWSGPFEVNLNVYQINGVSPGDTFIFNISNVSNSNDRDLFEIVGYFRNNTGFSVTFWKNGEEVSFDTGNWAGDPGYSLDDNADLDSYKLQVTIGEDPELQGFDSIYAPILGLVGFPSDGNGQYYLWELLATGQWSDSSGGGSAAPLTYGNPNSYADPTGELRSLINQIKSLSGSLIGWK